ADRHRLRGLRGAEGGGGERNRAGRGGGRRRLALLLRGGRRIPRAAAGGQGHSAQQRTETQTQAISSHGFWARLPHMGGCYSRAPRSGQCLEEATDGGWFTVAGHRLHTNSANCELAQVGAMLYRGVVAPILSGGGGALRPRNRSRPGRSTAKYVKVEAASTKAMMPAAPTASGAAPVRIHGTEIRR